MYRCHTWRHAHRSMPPRKHHDTSPGKNKTIAKTVSDEEKKKREKNIQRMCETLREKSYRSMRCLNCVDAPIMWMTSPKSKIVWPPGTRQGEAQESVRAYHRTRISQAWHGAICSCVPKNTNPPIMPWGNTDQEWAKLNKNKRKWLMRP